MVYVVYICIHIYVYIYIYVSIKFRLSHLSHLEVEIVRDTKYYIKVINSHNKTDNMRCWLLSIPRSYHEVIVGLLIHRYILIHITYMEKNTHIIYLKSQIFLFFSEVFLMRNKITNKKILKLKNSYGIKAIIVTGKI